MTDKLMGWQPIETAPKIEGRELLLLVDGKPQIGRWACWHGHGGIEAEGWNNTHQNFPTGSITPTHWMPPPEEPR